MFPRSKLAFLVLIFLLLGSIAARPPQQPGGEDERYFPETDRTVSGEFLDAYEAADDPLLIFGLPISDVVDHPVLPGVKVQYFQKVRMDWDPKAPEGERLRLAPLGVWLYDGNQKGKPVDQYYTPGACRLFRERNLTLCYGLLEFYNQHNGEVYFGEPISPMLETSSGRLMQYFERARMEWWPELPAGKRVVLSDLGKIWVDTHDPVVDARPKGDSGIIGDGVDQKLVVHVFTARPLVAPNSKQTIYVVVQNQTFQPVEGALVTLSMQLPNGQVITSRLDETKVNGLTQTDLQVGAFKPNDIVRVSVSVNLPQGPSAAASTCFRIWW